MIYNWYIYFCLTSPQDISSSQMRLLGGLLIIYTIYKFTLCWAIIIYTLPLSTYWTSSNWCHLLLTKLTSFTAFPMFPICVAIWRWPFLCVNIAGILSPNSQQSASVEVRRSSSAYPWLRLLPSKELMYKSKVRQKVGPQVGSVANRLPCPIFSNSFSFSSFVRPLKVRVSPLTKRRPFNIWFQSQNKTIQFFQT